VKLSLRTLAGVPAEYCGCMAGPGFLFTQTGDGKALGTVRTGKKQRLVAAKGAGCGMTELAVLTFIAVGAIMIFALRADSPHWINLQITGVVLVLAGVLGIALPPMAHISLLPRRYQVRTGRRSPWTRD
jgi:hypothetical protein